MTKFNKAVLSTSFKLYSSNIATVINNFPKSNMKNQLLNKIESIDCDWENISKDDKVLISNLLCIINEFPQETMSKLLKLNKVIKRMEKLYQNSTIIEYLRSGKKREPHGVMVGVNLGNNRFDIGVSTCHKLDHFDKNIGKLIAIDRAIKTNISIPYRLADESSIPKFIIRCYTYFKGMTPQSEYLFTDKILHKQSIE